MLPRHVLLSTLELNWAEMSLVEGARSVPASLFARAIEYHVFAMGAPVKSESMEIAPALPRTPPVASQGVKGSKLAWTRIVTVLGKIVPQMLQAVRKTFRRCSPRVVPGLPPTGAAGVVSLKPSPVLSRLIRTKLAACAAMGAI